MVYRTPSSDGFDELLGELDFIVEVRSFRLDLATHGDWRAAFAKRLEDWCFVLNDGNELTVKNWPRDERGSIIDRETFTLDAVGSFQFFESNEIVVPSDAAPVECPLVPPPFGFFCVKLDWSAWENTASELVTALIKEGMGRIFGTSRQWKQDREIVGRSPTSPPIPLQRVDVVCTTLRSFPLFLHKWSIDDGDVLLSRSDPLYTRYVISSVKGALDALGYEGELGCTPTSHNPFRYWQEEDRFYIQGKDGSRPTQKELEALLSEHSFEIWVYDFDAVARLVESTGVSVMWS